MTVIRVATVLGLPARRRAGLAFSPDWLELEPELLAPADLGAILTDPHLRFELQDPYEANETPIWRAPTEAELEQVRTGFAAFLQFHAAGEGEGTDGGHMTVGGEGEPSPVPEPKDGEVKDASSADLPGTATAAAADAEESREQADAGPAVATAPADEGTQPATTAQSPVAASNRKPSGRKPKA